jgi:2-haloacid dehalogenase
VSSADTVRRFKPAPEPYAMAAETLGLPPAEILFAAAHDWDVTGAMKAGYRTAFIARHGMSLNPLEAPPETIAPDIRALADAIVGAEIPA